MTEHLQGCRYSNLRVAEYSDETPDTPNEQAAAEWFEEIWVQTLQYHN